MPVSYTHLDVYKRQGVGLFGGAAPNVWLAGTYQNTGLNYAEYTLNNPGPIFTPEVNPPYIPAGGTATPACYPVATLATCARANVDIAAPGL